MSDEPGVDGAVDEWLVKETGFDLEGAGFHETVFTVGNGRIGTRGSLEEGHRGQLSGTFLNGVYDGHDVPVIDLVNAPDWLDTAVFAGGVRLDVDTCTVVAHHRTLDLATGCCTGPRSSKTARAAARAWRRCGAPAWRIAGSARCGSRSPPRTTRRRSA